MRFNRSKYHLVSQTGYVSLALLLGVVLAHPALADDGKVYPGGMCKESIEGYHQKRASGDIVFDFDGNALNTSTSSTRYVSCPLIRDRHFPEGIVTHVAVSYYKATSTGLACQLVSKEYFDEKSKVGEPKWDFSAGGHDRRIFELPIPVESSVSGGYNIWCILPPTVKKSDGTVEKTGIVHYGIVEAGASDEDSL